MYAKVCFFFTRVYSCYSLQSSGHGDQTPFFFLSNYWHLTPGPLTWTQYSMDLYVSSNVEVQEWVCMWHSWVTSSSFCDARTYSTVISARRKNAAASSSPERSFIFNPSINFFLIYKDKNNRICKCINLYVYIACPNYYLNTQLKWSYIWPYFSLKTHALLGPKRCPFMVRFVISQDPSPISLRISASFL